MTYRAKKLCRTLVVFLLSMLVLSLLVFVIARLAPGDPLVSYYGERAEKMKPAERAQAEARLGLDQPIAQQYLIWLKGALRGEFGISYKYKMDVLEVIRTRLPFTLQLGGIGFLLTFFLSLGLGVLCARHEDSLLDRALCKIGTVTSCIPEFWLSLVLILIFAVQLRWLPSSGAYDVGKANDAGSRVLHLILPLTVVVLGHLWYYAYLVRNKMLEEMRMDYVLLAKSKGARAQTDFIPALPAERSAVVPFNHGDLRAACAGRDIHCRERLLLPRTWHAELRERAL